MKQVSVWQASKLIASLVTDIGKAKIPTLQVKDPVMKWVTKEAADNKSKGHLFYKTFSLPPNLEMPPIHQDNQYPPLRWELFKNITDEQIHHTIKKMKPYKASKKGSVPNSVLIHAREDLIPYLSPLFHATNTLKYYPQERAITKILILKKPGKLDYMAPSA